MEEDHLLRVRRAIMRLKLKANGESVTVRFNDGPADEMAQHAVAFSRTKMAGPTGVRVERIDGGMLLWRDDSLAGSRFAPIDRLEVGESHVFRVAPTEHLSVRTNVSQRAKASGKRFSCNVVDEGMRVTRVALDAPITRGRPPGAAASRVDLEPLNQYACITFRGPKIEAVRNAASMQARTRGWDITTRVNRDGSITVYRLDNLTKAPEPQQLEAAT